MNGNVNLLHPLPLALSTSSARSPERRSADTIAVIADTIAVIADTIFAILGQESCSVKKKESEVYRTPFPFISYRRFVPI
jgi:hypothetical protein